MMEDEGVKVKNGIGAKAENFLGQLSFAAQLSGGDVDARRLGDMTLREVYTMLYPNGIRLAFSLHGKFHEEGRLFG